MNQVAVLFEDHGLESYVVPTDGSSQATFLGKPAKTVSIDGYKRRLKEEDITIDLWPDRRLVEIATQKKNQTRIFWQHGASIPIGGSTVGDMVFRHDNPYTQHWNVSHACADYFQQEYGISMSVVHPFFDSPTMKEYQQRINEPRDGFLLVARRGKEFFPAIQQQLSGQRVTIMKQPYHERDFFEALLRHKFFISTDAGIHQPSFRRKAKNAIRFFLSSNVRQKARQTNRWIVPKEHLLGFPMPPVEAAWLGCVVIGFAMGGGLEWMDKKNCFLALDGDETSLLSRIDAALHASEETLAALREQAIQDTSVFTREHTWEQIAQLVVL